MTVRTIALRITATPPSSIRRCAAFLLAPIIGVEKAAGFLVDGFRFGVKEIPDPTEPTVGRGLGRPPFPPAPPLQVDAKGVRFPGFRVLRNR